MSCPGLHCPGCGRGGSAASLIVPAVAALAAWWAFENLVAVVVVVALSFALSLATVSWLIRLTQKREARVGLQLAEWRRAGLPRPERRPERLPQQERRAVSGDLHLHFHGLPDTAAAAAIIRQAVSAPASDTDLSDTNQGDTSEHRLALPAGGR